MFSLDDFLNQYYIYISAILFFLTYTGLLVHANIKNQNFDTEDYFLSFVLVSLTSVVWIFIIPVIVLFLLVSLYIKCINWISQAYIKRNKIK